MTKRLLARVKYDLDILKKIVSFLIEERQELDHEIARQIAIAQPLDDELIELLRTFNHIWVHANLISRPEVGIQTKMELLYQAEKLEDEQNTGNIVAKRLLNLPDLPIDLQKYLLHHENELVQLAAMKKITLSRDELTELLPKVSGRTKEVLVATNLERIEERFLDELITDSDQHTAKIAIGHPSITEEHLWRIILNETGDKASVLNHPLVTKSMVLQLLNDNGEIDEAFLSDKLVFLDRYHIWLMSGEIHFGKKLFYQEETTDEIRYWVLRENNEMLNCILPEFRSQTTWHRRKYFSDEDLIYLIINGELESSTQILYLNEVSEEIMMVFCKLPDERLLTSTRYEVIERSLKTELVMPLVVRLMNHQSITDKCKAYITLSTGDERIRKYMRMKMYELPINEQMEYFEVG